MPPRLTLVGVTLLLFAASVCRADESGIAWNGFLNIVGGVLQDKPVIDYSDSPQTPIYQTYDDTFNFDSQTSAGLQAQKRLDDKTAVTLQLLAKGGADQYDANIKWLYLTYEPTYHSSFRIGKIAAPLYYYSDYLNVGYAYHWISPPDSVYPFDTGINGVDYVYQNSWGAIDWSGELMLGSGNDYLPLIEAHVKTHDSVGIALNLSTEDWLSFRAMVLQTDATFEMDALQDDGLDSIIELAADAALEEAGVAQDIAQLLRPTLITATASHLDNGALDLEDFPVIYSDLAIRAETGRWFLMAELIDVETDTYLYNDYLSKFITGGVHFGDALVHLTLVEGRANPHDDTSADRHNTTPTSFDMDAVGDVVASQIRTLLAGAFQRNQKSASIGVRYETSPSTALKFEITRFEELPSFEGDTFGVGKNTLFRTALNATF